MNGLPIGAEAIRSDLHSGTGVFLQRDERFVSCVHSHGECLVEMHAFLYRTYFICKVICMQKNFCHIGYKSNLVGQDFDFF